MVHERKFDKLDFVKIYNFGYNFGFKRHHEENEKIRKRLQKNYWQNTHMIKEEHSKLKDEERGPEG